MPRLALVGLTLAICQACTYPSDTSLRAAGGAQSFELVRARPEAGALGVSPNSPIDLTFNVPPDAESVAGAGFRVFSGLIETLGHLDVDLLDRRIRFTPTEPLRPSLRYQVYVHRSLSGLNGARLQDTVVFNFTTGGEDRLPPPPSPAPVDRGEVQAVWDRLCTSCHRPPAAPLGLDLSSAQVAVETLRNVPSAYGDRPRVVPGNHAGSYLMLKLLGVGPFVGFTMPPGGPQVAQDDLRRIATWIDNGAP